MSVVPEVHDPAALRDWHGTFRAIHNHSRVHWDGGVGAYLVTHYEDVRAGLYDQRLSPRGPTSFMSLMSEAEQREFAELREFYESWMVFSVSPYHERVRGAVQGVLTPRAVAQRKQAVRDAVERQLECARGGVVDFYSDFARPLATGVICEVLDLDEKDWDTFSLWSNELLSFIGLPRPTADGARRAQRAFEEMRAFVLSYAERLRSEGKDSNPVLAVAEAGEQAMVGTFAQFLTGGTDPISAGIGNSIASLLSHRDQLERLRADRSLLPTAVEELIRFESPFTLTPRIVQEPMTLHDQELPEGTRLMLMLTAANRDPAVFDKPDEVDIARSPNPHLGFGQGSHYCIGAGLARLEMSETLDAVVDTAATLEFAGPVEWTESLGLRSVVKLPLTVSGR